MATDDADSVEFTPGAAAVRSVYDGVSFSARSAEDNRLVALMEDPERNKLSVFCATYANLGYEHKADDVDYKIPDNMVVGAGAFGKTVNTWPTSQAEPQEKTIVFKLVQVKKAADEAYKESQQEVLGMPGMPPHWAQRYTLKAMAKEKRSVLREIELTRKVQAIPMTTRLLGVWTNVNAVVFLMEKDGESLRDATKPGGMAYKDTVRDAIVPIWMKHIFSTVAWIHSKGIVHLDLHTGNVLTQRDDPEQIRIIDFGRAAEGRVTDAWKVETNLWPPELWMNDDHGLDYKADIYQLGLMWWELMNKARPDEGYPSAKPFKNQGVDTFLKQEVDKIKSATKGLDRTEYKRRGMRAVWEKFVTFDALKKDAGCRFSAGATSTARTKGPKIRPYWVKYMLLCLSFAPETRPTAEMVVEKMVEHKYFPKPKPALPKQASAVTWLDPPAVYARGFDGDDRGAVGGSAEEEEEDEETTPAARHPLDLRAQYPYLRDTTAWRTHERLLAEYGELRRKLDKAKALVLRADRQCQSLLM